MYKKTRKTKTKKGEERKKTKQKSQGYCSQYRSALLLTVDKTSVWFSFSGAR